MIAPQPTETASENCVEGTREHLKAGYANAQETIRFIDTKTGVMTGLLIATTGAPLLFFKWVTELEERGAMNYERFAALYPISKEIIVFGLIAGMVLGVIGILAAVDGLMARSPRRFYQGIFGCVRRFRDKFRNRYKKKHDKPPLTVLFPIYRPEEEECAKSYFERAAKGISDSEMGGEYAVQLHQAGRILCRKITCNQRSVRFFSFQLIAYVLTGMASFVAVKFFGC